MGCASQGGREVDLGGVTELVDYKRDKLGCGEIYQGDVIVAEEGYESFAECEEYSAADGGDGERDMVSGPADAPHRQGVVSAGGIGHEYRYARADTVVDAETESSYYDEDLKRGEREGAVGKPSGYEGGGRKRACLHCHLQSDRYRCPEDMSGCVDRRGGCGEATAVSGIVAAQYEHEGDENRAQQPGGECGYAGTRESEFGTPHVAVDEQEVPGDVDDVGGENNYRGHDGIADGVAPLGEDVEKGDRDESGEVYDIVRAYERQQGPVPDKIVEEEVYRRHDQSY